MASSVQQVQQQPGPAAVGSLLFSDLQDSPLFRSKVGELDGNLEKLKERASKLTKASKKYSGVLDTASLGTSAFADRWASRLLGRQCTVAHSHLPAGSLSQRLAEHAVGLQP